MSKKVLLITFMIVGLMAGVFYAWHALTESVSSSLNERYCQIVVNSLKTSDSARAIFYTGKPRRFKHQSKYLDLTIKNLALPVSAIRVLGRENLGMPSGVSKTLVFEGYSDKPLFAIDVFDGGSYQNMVQSTSRDMALDMRDQLGKAEGSDPALWMIEQFEQVSHTGGNTPLASKFWHKLAIRHFDSGLAMVKGMERATLAQTKCSSIDDQTWAKLFFLHLRRFLGPTNLGNGSEDIQVLHQQGVIIWVAKSSKQIDYTLTTNGVRFVYVTAFCGRLCATFPEIRIVMNGKARSALAKSEPDWASTILDRLLLHY